jgi:hypothetical protein
MRTRPSAVRGPALYRLRRTERRQLLPASPALALQSGSGLGRQGAHVPQQDARTDRSTLRGPPLPDADRPVQAHHPVPVGDDPAQSLGVPLSWTHHHAAEAAGRP